MSFRFCSLPSMKHWVETFYYIKINTRTGPKLLSYDNFFGHYSLSIPVLGFI